MDGTAGAGRPRGPGGVEVVLRRFAPGEAEVADFGGHLVTLHLGEPTRGAFRQGDLGTEMTETRGNVMVVPAGRPAWQALFDDSEAVNVLLGERLVREVAEGAGVDPDGFEVVGGFEDRDPMMGRIVRSFLSELETGNPGGGLYAGALANELSVRLLRRHSSLGRRGAGRLARREFRGLSRSELARAEEFINDNLAADFSLEEVAAAAGLSTYHFARLFKLSTGVAVHRYAIRRRTERARDLLLRGRPIAAAALEVGFYDQSHLGRHFKRLFGATPKQALENSKHVL